MCRVSSYFGCQNLRVGTIIIAVVCIIYSTLDLAVTAIIFSFNIMGKEDAILYVMAGLRVFFDLLMIIFSSILLYGVKQGKKKKINMWWYFAVVYLVELAVTVVLVCVIILQTEESDVIFPVLYLVLTILFGVYLSYGLVVVYSYKKELEEKNEKGEEEGLSPDVYAPEDETQERGS